MSTHCQLHLKIAIISSVSAQSINPSDVLSMAIELCNICFGSSIEFDCTSSEQLYETIFFVSVLELE